MHPAPGAFRILVAEDEPSLGRLLRESLTRAGHEVEVSEDGRDALRRYRPGTHDLLILDSMLPERSGFDVVAQIRNAGDVIPIIMTSASLEPGRVESFAFTYRVELLHKPFGVRDLRAAIDRAVRDSGR